MKLRTMLRHAWHGLCCVLALTASPLLFATTPPQPQPTCVQGICLSDDPLPHGYHNILEMCPDIHMLSRQHLIWGAPGGWVSQDRSLTANIQTFRGAQWQGIRLGKVICIYGGTQGQDFTVVLQQTTDQLVPVPHGKSWRDAKNGVAECLPKDAQPLQPSDCAFINKQSIDATDQDPTDMLDFFNKSKTPSS